MRLALRLARIIDRISEGLGRAVAWLTVAMIALAAFNTLARYANRLGFDLASNAYIEAQWYLFGAIFMLGAAAALRENAHVRVDVIYGRLSLRAQAWIDVIGTTVFLIPFCIVAILVAGPAVASSWRILEGSPDPGGLPRYPIKTLIPVGFALVLLQGASQLIHGIARLRGVEPFEQAPSDPAAPHAELLR